MACIKKWIAAASLLAVGLATCFAVVSHGQAPGVGGAIELLPPAAYPNSGSAITSTGMIAPNPRGVDVPARKRLLGMVLVNTAPGSTGVGGSTFLDVFFQSSPDNGLSWQDFAHVNVGPNGTGTYLLPISFVDGSSYPTTIPANQDGTMANNTISQYVIGRRIRAKYQLGYKQGSAGQWAFHVLVVPN